MITMYIYDIRSGPWHLEKVTGFRFRKTENGNLGNNLLIWAQNWQYFTLNVGFQTQIPLDPPLNVKGFTHFKGVLKIQYWMCRHTKGDNLRIRSTTIISICFKMTATSWYSKPNLVYIEDSKTNWNLPRLKVPLSIDEL